MKITQIRLRRFKRFSDWQTGLAPGLTVIRGPNEAGKTTVMDAVCEGLFGAPGGSDARLRSWGEQRHGEITVELQTNGNRFLLRKDLEAGTILLQSEDGRERFETHRDVQRRLLEWIGMASEGAYRATAFVAQADIARVGEDRRMLSTHLSRIMSGSGVESVQQALQWLHERRGRLAGDLQGGKATTERVTELRAQQISLRQREERAQRHRLELRAVLQRLEAVEREAAEETEMARVSRWAGELQQREKALIDEETSTKEHLSRAETLLTRLAKLDAELAEFSSQREAMIADLFHARRQFLQLDSSLSTSREHAEREERNLEQLATKHQQTMRRGAMGWTLAGSGTIGIVGGALILAFLPNPIGWILLAAGAGVTLLGMRLRGRISEAGADYRMQEQRVLDLRNKVEAMKRQIGEAEAMVSSKLQAVGGSSMEDVERRFSTYMDLLRQREEVRASLRLVRGNDPKKALDGRLREIAEELSSVRATLETLPKGTRRASAGGGETLEKQAKQLSTELSELRERRARLEGVLDELRDRSEEGPRIEEEIASLQAETARNKRTLEVLDLAARMLEEARTLSVYPARELLERRAGDYLSRATGGAYGKVSLDERSLRPQVWVSSAASWKDALDLSQATSDQLYLCLRFALLDVITGDRRPPVFLDEPFAHLDEDRRRAMTDLLKVAAKERQVVLLTCWPDYDEVAEQVIVLKKSPAS